MVLMQVVVFMEMVCMTTVKMEEMGMGLDMVLCLQKLVISLSTWEEDLGLL